MKASELIKEIQKRIELHGDLPMHFRVRLDESSNRIKTYKEADIDYLNPGGRSASVPVITFSNFRNE